MQVLLLIILLIAVVLIITLKQEMAGKIDILEDRIDNLRQLLERVNINQQTAEHKAAEDNRQQQPVYTPPPVTPIPVFSSIVKSPPLHEPEPEEIISQPKAAVVEPIEFVQPEPEAVPAFAAASYDSFSASPPQAAGPEKTFFEKNPDLEKFIGENLANKIGIAILVLGIGFFVKYAIDQQWISETGRVFIGILCGGILISIAHRLRNSFSAFSSVLVGGGIAVLYFTIAIAFHEYRLLSQVAAFLLMVVITGFSVLFSIVYDKRELAVLSIIGGFATPFMLSTGEGNYVVLFSYLLILNAGMLVLAYHKKWSIVYLISYAFTILIYGGWLLNKFNPQMTAGALTFATAFYLVFFFMNIINNLKERTSIRELEIWLLLSNTFLYYAAGMYVLHNPVGYDYRGLFTASMGVFNFIFAYALFRNKRVDKNIIYLLIGLVLTFISLAAPVQLEGNHITLFWSAEAVLLLWLAQKSGIKLIKYTSVIVMGLMMVSLIMDWAQIYQSYTTELNVLVNKGYITSLVSLASLVVTYKLLREEDADEYMPVSQYKSFLVYTSACLVYLFNLLELHYHLRANIDLASTRYIILGTYNMVFLLLIVLMRNRLPAADKVINLPGYAGVLAVVAYLVAYYPFTLTERTEYLLNRVSALGFAFHYLLLALVLVISALGLRNFIKNPPVEKFNRFTWWFFIGAFVFIASTELDNIILMISHNPGLMNKSVILRHSHKIGYPILWGVSAFILIAIGMKEKIKDLRIISLTLLTITLLKLFLFDIRGISEAGKIIAFISLGVLLLVVSFMYQKLKKLLLDDNNLVTEKETE